MFFAALLRQLRVVWPILSGILLVMAGLGLVIGWIEDWRIQDSLYFTFVTGLTIGYGDLAPKYFASRMIALAVGFCGIVLTGLVAALCVEALRSVHQGYNAGDR